jgi:hypothetical protein
LPDAQAIMTPIPDDASHVLKSPATSVLDLPNEILIDILSQAPSTLRQQRQNLVQVASVYRHLRPLAMEEFLLRLAVHLEKVWVLVRTYIKYPHLTARVRSVELLDHVITYA